MVLDHYQSVEAADFAEVFGEEITEKMRSLEQFPRRGRAMPKIDDAAIREVFYRDYRIVYIVDWDDETVDVLHDIDDAVSEARRLVEAGFAEVVLTGIHLGKYGVDLDGNVELADAVRAIADVPGLERLRLSSIKADEVTDELLAAMQAPSVCPHLHLPLQSGDDAVLSRMQRGYTAAEFLDAVDRAREALERPAITTDVMAGFPGETEEMFEETMDVCRRAGFSRLHVFPFSAREGTEAAEMPGHIHSKVRKERCRRLRELAEKLAAEWARSFVGQQVEALFERRRSGLLSGYTARYAPIEAEGPQDAVGRTVRVRCRSQEKETLKGTIPDAGGG